MIGKLSAGVKRVLWSRPDLGLPGLAKTAFPPGQMVVETVINHENLKRIESSREMTKTAGKDVDVVIVGAGPAGSAAAYDLCRSGKSVLLLDRHAFPRHKACAGGLTVKTLKTLRYPVDPVIKNRCNNLDIGDKFSRPVRFSGRQMLCAMTIRSEFDAFCLEKAMAVGAQFRTIHRIDLIRENQSTVQLQTDTGTLRSTFLIGADGANSQIRRLCGEFTKNFSGFAIEGTLPCKPDSLPSMGFDFNAVTSGYGWIFPKDDHVNIGLFTGSRKIKLQKQDLLAYALMKLGRGDVDHISGHTMGMGGWRYHPQSQRILLAGDAAGLVDPLLGEGLYNAVKSGQLAARAIKESESSKKTAGCIYNRLLKNIRKDLLYCCFAAYWFYKMPCLGHRILTSRPVKYALMKGFAMGLAEPYHRWWVNLRIFIPSSRFCLRWPLYPC